MDSFSCAPVSSAQLTAMARASTCGPTSVLLPSCSVKASVSSPVRVLAPPCIEKCSTALSFLLVQSPTSDARPMSWSAASSLPRSSTCLM